MDPTAKRIRHGTAIAPTLLEAFSTWATQTTQSKVKINTLFNRAKCSVYHQFPGTCAETR